MDKLLNKTMIVDGSYMLHRQLHQRNIFDLRSSDGHRTGGIFGFIRSLNKEMMSCDYNFPIVVFDGGLSERRTNIYSSYKRADERQREHQILLENKQNSEQDEYLYEYRQQRNYISEILEYMGVPVVRIPGWEGDDIMYIISEMSNRSTILSDDKDMLQLLSSNCDVCRPMSGRDTWNMEDFMKINNLDDMYEFVIAKSIVGDASDNIPGSCPGVGSGNSYNLAKIIRRYSINRNTNSWQDMSDYPTDEKSMRDLCSSLGVVYRKAYMNFDRDRFIDNVGLIDLHLVEFDERVIDSILSTIRLCRSKVNFFKLIERMKYHEIKDISIDSVIEKISVRYNNLFIQE